MTRTQVILYCVIYVLACTAAWLAGQTDGKRRGYKKGYEEGKAYVRATPDYRAFLLRRAEQKGLVKIDTRPVEHLRATMMVSAEDQMLIPVEAMAESIARELKKRLLEALAPYWTIRHEYRPEVHAYEYTMHLDVLRKEARDD